LPRIEEITAGTDIAGFLRKGVPESLRNAALRQMWLVDPAVRNYVGDARDYAWDWNVPGGVPGSGTLLPGDNAEEVLRTMFSDTSRAEERQVASGSAIQKDECLPRDTNVADVSPLRRDRFAAVQQTESDPVDQLRAEARERQAPPEPVGKQANSDGPVAVQRAAVEQSPNCLARSRHGRARPV
jgi:hypothetical protein